MQYCLVHRTGTRVTGVSWTSAMNGSLIPEPLVSSQLDLEIGIENSAAMRLPRSIVIGRAAHCYWRGQRVGRAPAIYSLIDTTKLVGRPRVVFAQLLCDYRSALRQFGSVLQDLFG